MTNLRIRGALAALLIAPLALTACSHGEPKAVSGESSSPSPTATSASPTPTPAPVPSQPTGVRTTSSTYVGGQVEVSLTFTAPTGGPRPTAFDVVRTQAGGTGSGTTTTYSWDAVTSGTVSVKAPPSGVRYLWSVRSRIGSQVSAASAARATVPTLVGLAAWQARDELRAVGLSGRTTLQKVTNAKQVGRVIAQAVKAGKVVGPGTAVGITVGS